MTVPVRSTRRGDHELRMAWIAVALVPVAFVLAILTGEGLISLLGYDASGAEVVPVGAALLAGVPAMLILMAPAAAAVWYGYRGYRAGREAARLPAWIGAAVGVMVLATNLLQLVAALIVGR